MTTTILSNGTHIEHMGLNVFHAIYDPLLHGELKPCPFCGGTELEVINTHTPSYWVECSCGAQKDGDYEEPKIPDATEEFDAFDLMCGYYVRAMKSAVTEWNRRA